MFFFFILFFISSSSVFASFLLHCTCFRITVFIYISFLSISRLLIFNSQQSGDSNKKRSPKNAMDSEGRKKQVSKKVLFFTLIVIAISVLSNINVIVNLYIFGRLLRIIYLMQPNHLSLNFKPQLSYL